MKRDSKRTAFLTLDIQKGILGYVPNPEPMVANAAKAVDFARKHNFLIIHVGLGFSEVHLEIPDFESPFLRVKQNNLFVKGSPSAEFHVAIFKPGDLVIYKQ